MQTEVTIKKRPYPHLSMLGNNCLIFGDISLDTMRKRCSSSNVVDINKLYLDESNRVCYPYNEEPLSIVANNELISIIDELIDLSFAFSGWPSPTYSLKYAVTMLQNKEAIKKDFFSFGIKSEKECSLQLCKYNSIK